MSCVIQLMMKYSLNYQPMSKVYVISTRSTLIIVLHHFKRCLKPYKQFQNVNKTKTSKRFWHVPSSLCIAKVCYGNRSCNLHFERSKLKKRELSYLYYPHTKHLNFLSTRNLLIDCLKRSNGSVSCFGSFKRDVTIKQVSQHNVIWQEVGNRTAALINSTCVQHLPLFFSISVFQSND